MKNAWMLLAAVCALVIGVYAYMAQSGVLELLSPNAAGTYYNLLVQGFRAGHLSLKKEVPPWFSRLADPYDPAAHLPYQDPLYRMRDLSYYKGRFYLYFGVTPVLILFWPYVALTGQYLFDRQAVMIFCTAGFLASVGLLRALWRRYFAGVSGGVVAACALALGLATGVPVLLARADVYEVAISCGYMLTMLSLAAIWRALHEPERRCRWLVAASVAYGLAVGARPSLLFGSVILLVPVAQAWREQRPECLPRSTWLSGLLAATVPILLIGLGLMFYNARRFDSPFQFGMRYSLTNQRLGALQFFSLRYLWFNLRVYFLEPARWSARFPFVHEIAMPPMPRDHGGDRPFGILTNIPLVWLALAVPLARWNRPGPAGTILRWFVTAVALLFGICALTLAFFINAAFRYEVDFLPALLWLAVVGIFGLERALAGRPAWRWKVRWGWGLLLGFSVAFSVLASVENYAPADCTRGDALARAGRVPEAIQFFEKALRLKPDFAEAHCNLGIALERVGRTQEAMEHFEQAVKINPDYVGPHYNLGLALLRLGRVQEAIGHWKEALRIRPDFAEAHCNLGIALAQLGETQDAMEHLEQALRLEPDLAEARTALARLQGGQ
ncbi:MAG: tetratricopeptide repeat protein [Verrucomicrobiia bacterium]